MDQFYVGIHPLFCDRSIGTLCADQTALDRPHRAGTEVGRCQKISAVVEAS